MEYDDVVVAGNTIFLLVSVQNNPNQGPYICCCIAYNLWRLAIMVYLRCLSGVELYSC